MWNQCPEQQRYEENKSAVFFLGKLLRAAISSFVFVMSSSWTSWQLNVDNSSLHCMLCYCPTWCKPTGGLWIWKEHEFLMVTGQHWYDLPFPLEGPRFFNFWPLLAYSWLQWHHTCREGLYWYNFPSSLEGADFSFQITFGHDWLIHAMWL